MNQRVQFKGNFRHYVRRKLQNKGAGEVIEKNGNAKACENRYRPLYPMIFATTFGCLFLAKVPPGSVPSLLSRLFGTAHELVTHLVERAGDFLGYVVEFEVAHHLLELRQGPAIAAGDSLAQGDRFADDFQVCATDTAVLQTRHRFSSALGTVHCFLRTNRSRGLFRLQSLSVLYILCVPLCPLCPFMSFDCLVSACSFQSWLAILNPD